jgi:Family of unknown function (DUF6386)
VINETLIFSTDAATLAVFDPQLLQSKVAAAGDWWVGQFHCVPEVADGRIALFGLGGDGVYKVRVTDQELTDAETSYATAAIALGIQVTSGYVFVGAGECLPGDGVQFDSSNAANGTPLAMPAGEYLLTGYSIEWQAAPDWFADDAQPVPAAAPADLVLQLAPRVVPFAAPRANPRFFAAAEDWLFPERPRRLGPVPGMLLSTSVALRRDDLVLKPCGPGSYRPVVPDMSRLRWKDRARVRVVAVNHDAREFTAEIVAVES